MNDHPFPLVPAEHFRSAMREARKSAIQQKRGEIRSTDLLVGMLQEAESPAIHILGALGVNRKVLRAQAVSAFFSGAASESGSGPDLPSEMATGTMPLTRSAEAIAKGAVDLYQMMQKGASLGAEHLLAAMAAHSESEAGHLLAAQGVTYEAVRSEIERMG